MPPIKGRMMSRMGGPISSVQNDTKQVRNVKKVTMARKKWKTSPVKTDMKAEGSLPENITEDEKLMKLRMPSDIIRILPSVKKYKGGKDFVDLTDDVSVSGESSKSDLIIDEDQSSVINGNTSTKTLLGNKKGRKSNNKYMLQLIAEERFCSMIWDVTVAPNGNIFVSCCEGIFICDEGLDRKSKLDKIILPGGVDFMPDGQIVALCRNTDTVNFFNKDGIFIKAFPAGFSPMSLIINEKEKVIISDPGEKCVHVFDTKGNELHKIPTVGTGYKFQWPLYLSKVDDESFVVSDCHAQKVHKFMNNGRFVSTYKLKTSSGNEVIRPHGLCTYQELDLFVIDTSLDSVEVFTWDDSFVQTLITHEEGITLKPKCIGLNKDASLIVVGGRMGVVRVYQFLQSAEYENNKDGAACSSKQKIKQEIKTEVKSESLMEDSGVIVLE